jgi:hypothetical protein
MPDQKGILRFITYDFHKSLEGILPHPNLGLNGPELIRAMEVVEKVQKAKDEILLNDNDYELIVNTLKKFRGFTKNDHVFLKRIYDCPSVSGKIVKFSDNGKERK